MVEVPRVFEWRSADFAEDREFAGDGIDGTGCGDGVGVCWRDGTGSGEGVVDGEPRDRGRHVPCSGSNPVLQVKFRSGTQDEREMASFAAPEDVEDHSTRMSRRFGKDECKIVYNPRSGLLALLRQETSVVTSKRNLLVTFATKPERRAAIKSISNRQSDDPHRTHQTTTPFPAAEEMEKCVS